MPSDSAPSAGLSHARPYSLKGENEMSNRICEIPGIEKPVVQAPMVWLTDARLAAATSSAGGLGSLGPNAGQTTVTPDPKELPKGCAGRSTKYVK